MHIQLFVASVHASARRTIGDRAIELGADAAVPSGQDWQLVQAALLESLEAQLNILAATPKPAELRTALRQAIQSRSNANPTRPTQTSLAPIAEAETDDTAKVAPVCKIHEIAFQRFEKDGRSWWAHKQSGSWCNYKPEGV